MLFTFTGVFLRSSILTKVIRVHFNGFFHNHVLMLFLKQYQDMVSTQ
jgi:hypothetical protein